MVHTLKRVNMPKLVAPEYGGVWSWEGELTPATMLKLSDGREVSLGSIITLTNGDVLEWLDTQTIEKHLQGQHDQSTHAGKKSYKSIDDLVKDGLDIQATVDSLGVGNVVRDGNLAFRVLQERMGKGGKPEIVGSIEELDGEPIYRGADTKFNRELKEGEFARMGFGQYGDGNYFSTNIVTAEEYADFSNNPMYGGKGDVITAGWKKDAKVFVINGGSEEWMDVAMSAHNDAIKKLNINRRASDNEDAVFNLFYADHGNSLNTNLMLEGYDGLKIQFSIGGTPTEAYTIVFNREALQVVGG